MKIFTLMPIMEGSYKQKCRWMKLDVMAKYTVNIVLLCTIWVKMNETC